MVDTLKAAIRMFGLYIGESWQFALFLLAVLYLLLAKEEKDKRRLFVAYTGVFAFLYLCPLTAKIIMDYCIGELVYWRMFWLLPIPMVLAYTGTKIWRRQKNKAASAGVLVVLTALIVLSGHCVYGTDGPFQKAGNLVKLPPEVCWVCEIIEENAPEDGEMKAVVPTELAGYIRQYDSKIELAFGRWGGQSKRGKRLERQMLKESPNFEKIARLSRKIGCNFLVYPANEWQDENIRNLGYEPVGNVNTYVIYRDMQEAQEG